MAKKKPPGKKLLVDWASVHNLYKLGYLSLRAIAEQYKSDHVNSQTFKRTVSAPAIIKEAKKFKWKKDLAGKVQARTKEKLVNRMVNVVNQKTDEQIIEEAAEATTNVVVLHREQIKALVKHENDLLKELAENPTKVHISSYLGEVTETKLNLTVKERSATLKDLAHVRAQRIALERQAHGIVEDAGDGDLNDTRDRSPDEVLRRLAFLMRRGIEE